MFEQTWDILLRAAASMLYGTGLMLVGVGAGLAFGRYDTLVVVRLISWWLGRVVVPLLRSRHWAIRSVAVFVNNAVVLSLLLCVSGSYVTALIGAAALGVSLGIALQRLHVVGDDLTVALPPRTARGRRALRVGIALNLLEPAAIIITLGLCLGMTTVPLALGEAWRAFSVWVIPLLLAGACGEGLWRGVVSGRSGTQDTPV